MIDFDELQKRAREASARASQSLKESEEKITRLAEASAPGKKAEERNKSQAEQQASASQQKQVEILGQCFTAETMAQMAAQEEQLQQMVNEQVAQTCSLSAEAMMRQLFGEDMGVIAAALETLAMEDETGENEEDSAVLDLALEQSLYSLLEETMARLEALPEPEPVFYGKDSARWERFGILLSGIVSVLNHHRLDSMDVEPHIPVMEQQVVSIVRRSWGIDGRSGLLDMIGYLTREGYTLRYALYSQAASPEELLDGDEDEQEQENVARAWRFAQRYKVHYAPGFMAGWDIGRAAMLTRWGSYLGWITESEAMGILWELSKKAAEEIHSWREFAQSYLFGGLMWKLLCGDHCAASYLGYLSDAATNLLTGKDDEAGGQWRDCPWPARQKIGFM